MEPGHAYLPYFTAEFHQRFGNTGVLRDVARRPRRAHGLLGQPNLWRTLAGVCGRRADAVSVKCRADRPMSLPWRDGS